MKKKKLLIVGAGSVGGFISYNINDFGSYDILGFLDDDKKKIGKYFFKHKVLGSIDDLKVHVKDTTISVVVGVAKPEIRKKLIQNILSHGYNIDFPNFISSKAWISPGVILGKGAIIYPGVSINYECLLDNFIIINMNCALGHNCTISSFSTMAPGVNLGGYTYIGNETELCIGVSTKQGIRIGNQVLVGGQAMVVKNIPSNVKVMGVPAHVYNSKLPIFKSNSEKLNLDLLRPSIESIEVNKSN